MFLSSIRHRCSISLCLVSVAALRLMKAVFCDPSRMYIALFFSTLIFSVDIQHRSETLIFDLFVCIFFTLKVREYGEEHLFFFHYTFTSANVLLVGRITSQTSVYYDLLNASLVLGCNFAHCHATIEYSSYCPRNCKDTRIGCPWLTNVPLLWGPPLVGQLSKKCKILGTRLCDTTKGLFQCATLSVAWLLATNSRI